MLQFITNSETTEGTIRQAFDAIEGGCRWIQVRMKKADDATVANTVAELLPLCRSKGVTIIVDDRVKVAAATDADGVHLGKDDMPHSKARKILGKGKIIGATVNTLEDIESLPLEDIDYLGMGPFRFTSTKKRLAPILGIEGYVELMKELRRISSIPVVAIGGIALEDIEEILSSGVTGIALSGAVINSDNPVDTMKKFISKC